MKRKKIIIFTNGATNETHNLLFCIMQIFYKLILQISKTAFASEYLHMLLGVTFRQAAFK